MFIYDCLSLKILEINESSYFSLIDIRIVVKQPFEIFSIMSPPLRLTSNVMTSCFSQKLYDFENIIWKCQRIGTNSTEIQWVEV